MIKTIIPILIIKDREHYHLEDNRGNSVNVVSPDSLLEFLTIPCEPDECKICWNLFELFGILQQQLPKEVIEKLIKDDRVYFGEYKIFSSSGKVISIGRTKNIHDNFYKTNEVNIYGLRQYFPDEKPANLNELNYLSGTLMNTLKDLNWETNSLSSSIAIFDDAVLDKEYLPTIYTMPNSKEVDGLIEYAYGMMAREWRTVYKVSHFQNAVHYDLCGSYPSVIKDFYDTDDCEVRYAKNFQKCDIGVVKGEIDITSDYCPIVDKDGENKKGKYTDLFTTEQIGFLYHYKQGTFKIEDGFFLNYNSTIKPFNKIMNDLYLMRENGGLQQTLAKSASVGIWGRMTQEHPEKFGERFHPLYSVLTTSRTSIKVGKFILENQLQNDLISVIVDGLMTTKDVQCENTKQIGSWRKEIYNALVLSVGHLYFSDKKDVNSNTYETMMKAITEKPNRKYYNDVLLNKNMMTTRRDFVEYPKTGANLLSNVYASSPLIINK